MSNSRTVATYAAGLLGMVAFFGLGCQPQKSQVEKVDPALISAENALNQKVQHDPALEKLRPDLPRVENVINEESSNNPQVAKAYTRLLEGATTSAVSSPLKVRGGSVTVRSLTPIDCKSKEGTCQVQSPSVPIYLDGVLSADGNSLTTVKLTPQSNWSLLLSFRSIGHNPDPYHTLSICTDIGCKTSGSPGTCSVGGQAPTTCVYLQSDQDPHGDGWSTVDTQDTFASGKYFVGKKFSLISCNGGAVGGETVCNHISTVKYSSKGDPNDQTTYTCMNGECTIGIGDPY